MMHGREKSDTAIVAVKPTNKAVPTAAEPVEPRVEAKGNASQQSTRRTQSRGKRVTRAGAHTANRNGKTLCRHTPKVGAECPNGARSDLCGGRSVMSVPTAISEMFAKYPFERSHRFPMNPAKSGDRDYSRLSCGVGRRSSGLVPGSRQDACAGRNCRDFLPMPG